METRKKECIIFILKNDEYFLLHNIDTILDLNQKYDLVFVVRESKDRTIELLKANDFLILDLSYDSGYEEALKMGFEFVDNKKYDTVIEFGEINSILLNEIYRFNEINQEFGEDKQIIFASKTNKHRKKRKLFIYFAIFKKVVDPYTRFRIYNKKALRCIKSCFDFKLYPYNFIMLLYLMKGNYIEVKVKYNQNKISNQQRRKLISNHFDTFIYTIFITPFVKNIKIDKCEL